MAAGGLAGAAFWLACFPADVIKSKIQTDNYFSRQYRWAAGSGGLYESALYESARLGLTKLSC